MNEQKKERKKDELEEERMRKEWMIGRKNE